MGHRSTQMKREVGLYLCSSVPHLRRFLLLFRYELGVVLVFVARHVNPWLRRSPSGAAR
jgi:hypothetical protein